MTDTSFPDSLDTVIAAVAAALPRAYVADEAPPETVFEKRLPVVLIRDLPGGADDVPWQSATGPLTDVFAIDVDVYSTSREQCREYSRRLRGILYSLMWNSTIGATSVREVVGFARRPDHNARIKRDGAEFEFRIRRRVI